MKNSKTLILALAVGSAAIFNSCEKAKVDVSFDMDIADIALIADTTSQYGNITLASTQFQSTLQQTLDDNNANVDDVQSIELTGAEISMVNPGAQNFDIVDKAYGFMSATGIAESQVAYIDPVPDGVTQVTLTANTGDLKEYLKQTTVSFRVSGVTNGPNTERDSLLAKLSFKVKAKINPL